MDLQKTGQFLSGLRKQRGLTQKELAEQIGVTDKAISRWETGRGFPDVSFLPAIAELLGVSISEIVIGERMQLAEKETAAIMEKMERTVKDTLGYSQQELRKSRGKIWVVASALTLLGAWLLFCVFLLIYESVIQFWPDTSSRYAAYVLLNFLIVPIVVPVLIHGFRFRFPGITRLKTYWVALLLSFLLLMADTAWLCPEYYSSLFYVELLQYDFNDTMAYDLLFRILPLTWVITLAVNTICIMEPSE